MSAPFFIPFNFQPVAVSVKTASYTIPAGKYARVLVECDSGGTFTINSVTAVTTNAFVGVSQTSGNTSINSTYTTPANYRFTGQAVAAGGVLAGTVQVEAAGTSAKSLDVGPSVSITASASGATPVPCISGTSVPSNATHRQADLWLPSGTIINGTGTWRAVVMEYNEIT